MRFSLGSAVLPSYSFLLLSFAIFSRSVLLSRIALLFPLLANDRAHPSTSKICVLVFLLSHQAPILTPDLLQTNMEFVAKPVSPLSVG